MAFLLKAIVRIQVRRYEMTQESEERVINQILDRSLKNPLSKEEALLLFHEVKTPERFLRLAQAASSVRSREAGPTFKFDGFIGPITQCDTDPPCRYCGRSASGKSDSFRACLSVEEVELAAKLMKEAGIKVVELGGGTPSNGAAEKIKDAVRAVKRVSELDIWVNVGPALTFNDLLELREMGVKEVCSSLESINPGVFKEAKPGDDLRTRMKLAQDIDASGLGLMSVMMVGLGSSYQDYVSHLLWLKSFKNLSHLGITGLNPIPGTPFEDRPMANPFEVAKAGAIARLVLRNPDISFGGMMNDPRLLPLSVMVGGNRTIHLGAHAHKSGAWRLRYPGTVSKKIGDIEFVDMLPLTTRLVKDSGMEVA